MLWRHPRPPPPHTHTHPHTTLYSMWCRTRLRYDLGLAQDFICSRSLPLAYQSEDLMSFPPAWLDFTCVHNAHEDISAHANREARRTNENSVFLNGSAKANSAVWQTKHESATYSHPSTSIWGWKSLCQPYQEPVARQQSALLVPARHVWTQALSYGCQSWGPTHQSFIKNPITFSLPAFPLPATGPSNR